MRNDEKGRERTRIRVPRAVIAACASHSGKTLITCALLQALRNRGEVPAAFKCGPDFIDPMFHKVVTGNDSRNLDLFFSDGADIRRMIAGCGGTCAVIEGVMGIYDGATLSSIRGSTYEAAAESASPVILIADAAKKGRTLLAEIKGILREDTKSCVKGLILNRISGAFYTSLKDVLEKELDEAGFQTTVLGYLPVVPDLRLDSRHLGLVLPDEIDGIRTQIEKAAGILETTVDLDRLWEEMHGAAYPQIRTGPTKDPAEGWKEAQNHVYRPAEAGISGNRQQQKQDQVKQDQAGGQDKADSEEMPVLGIAYDSAFRFYYRENLDLFERKGVRLQFFSPLRDEGIPEHVSGLLFGGGYPEYHLKELSGNKAMLQSVRGAIEKGIPSLAECGGFMYLHDSIADLSGRQYRMVGAVRGECRYTGHLVRFGYLELAGTTMQDEYYRSFTGMKGHEFHYYESTSGGSSFVARKPYRDQQWSCMVTEKNGFWGFPHLYYASDPDALDRFIQKMKAAGRDRCTGFL